MQEQCGDQNRHRVGKLVSASEQPGGIARASDSDSSCSWRWFRKAEGSYKMLSRCANSKCGRPFLRLREGKLFLVETDRVTKAGESTAPPFVRARQPRRQVEHYWLCDGCASLWTLVYDRKSGVGLIPVRRPALSVPAGAARSGVA